MTFEDMEDQLANLGLEIIDSRGDEINSYCAAHEERTGHIDHNPSWWINADSGAFICFSCGWKGNIFTLVKYITGADLNSDFKNDPAYMTARFNRLFKEKKPVIEEPTHMTESMLSAFTEVPEHALKARGLTAVACSSHGVLWDERNNNWITVIRDPITHRLLGWQEKGFDRRYFKNVPSGIKKSNALFGYEFYSDGDMIVVESPLDVVRLSSLGILGSVSTFGSMVSDAQFNIIRGAKRIIFAMDNDEAGKSSSMSLLYKARDMGVECWFLDYGALDVKDIGAMSKSEILDCISKAKHSVHGEKAIA